MIVIEFIKLLKLRFPSLSDNLRKANMSISPDEFLKNTLKTASYMSLGLTLIIFFMIGRVFTGWSLLFILLFSLVLMFITMFFYLSQIPTVRIRKLDREINKEIIFAGRYLIVELESGVPLYDAMKNLGLNYPYVGAYFREIINKINIGTTMENAISETIEFSASDSLTKILWQITNSLKTGSNVARPLKTVIETLMKEQQIQVNEYAKKLNPLAMFYMLIAVIMPSLGTTMLTILAIFIGFQLNVVIFLLIAALNGFVQFLFIAMINSIRPPVEL